MILFAVVGSFTYVIAARRVGDQVAEFVAGLDVGPTTFLLLAMLFFLVVGILLALYGLKVRKKLRDLGPED